MTQQSAVKFETTSRIHMGLAVENLDHSVAFYRALLGQVPTKTRVRYAKFEVAEPPVNLALNEIGIKAPPTNPIAHFGVQVKSTGAIQVVADRLIQAGYAISVEEDVTCCYAVQDKIWTSDPDGNRWEVYVVLNDDAAAHRSAGSGCCDTPSESRESSPACCDADQSTTAPRCACA